MKSIRHQLTVKLLAGLCVLLGLASLLLGFAMHKRLLQEFDATLLAKARALVSLTEREGRAIEVDYSEDGLPKFGDVDEPEYFQIRLVNGPLIAKSPSLEDAALPDNVTPGEKPLFADLELPDGRKGRVVHIEFRPRVDLEDQSGEPPDPDDHLLFQIPDHLDPAFAHVVLTVARSRAEFNALIWSLYGMLAGVAGLLAIAIAIWVRSMTKHALRPIAEIDAQVAAIGFDALNDRVSINAPPEELHTIIHAVNQLLERLQRGFERERRFSSDVAHELRTPVSELRAACEVGGAWPDDAEATKAFFGDIRDIALQMETTVNNLLTLAGCDNGSAAVTREEVQLAALVRECWEHTAARAESRGVHLEIDVAPGHAIVTDRRKLAMVIQNLIDNAATYCAPASVIRCASANGGARVELEIENTVEDLGRDDLPRLFDRFWRKDPARSASGHSGLGLSIARSLCDLLGVGLSVDLRDDHRFVASLSFAAPPPAARTS